MNFHLILCSMHNSRLWNEHNLRYKYKKCWPHRASCTNEGGGEEEYDVLHKIS